MISWFLFGKKEIKKLKRAVQTAFEQAKQDFVDIGSWLEHLKNRDEGHEKEIAEIKKRLATIENDLDEIKNLGEFFSGRHSIKKHYGVQIPVYKQTAVYAVQTPVQTAVQIGKNGVLKGLTANERLIVWALLNTNMKVNYEDLATMLGKNKSTIRGQLNSIKQKNEMLINEMMDSEGKKRFYIEEDVKERLLKILKRGVKSRKKEPSEEDYVE